VFGDAGKTESGEMTENREHTEWRIAEEGGRPYLVSTLAHQGRHLEVRTRLEMGCCVSTISSKEKVVASFLQSIPSAQAAKEGSEVGNRIFLKMQHESVMRRILSGDYDLRGTSDPSLPALLS
jgi:hypothetical protein